MKNLTSTLLFIAIMIHNGFAQTAIAANTLSDALNALYADLPNECRNLYGQEDGEYKKLYESKIKVPNSVINSLDASSSNRGYPIVFRSTIPAGDDKLAAILKHNSLDKDILAITINYKNKNYKVIYITAESKLGEKPAYKYKLENGPAELENVKIYLDMRENWRVNDGYKYIIEVGIFRKIEASK